jgi:hypothetical protein
VNLRHPDTPWLIAALALIAGALIGSWAWLGACVVFMLCSVWSRKLYAETRLRPPADEGR